MQVTATVTDTVNQTTTDSITATITDTVNQTTTDSVTVTTTVNLAFLLCNLAGFSLFFK